MKILWQIVILMTGYVTTLFYMQGWRIYYQTQRQANLRPQIRRLHWQLAAFVMSGLAYLFVTLPPLQTLAQQTQLIHAGQIVALTGILPALLWVSNAATFIPTGTPQQVKKLLPARPKWIDQPVLAFGVFVVVIALWLDAALHNAALKSNGIHHLEIVMLSIVGLHYWWHIVEGARHNRPNFTHVLYTLGGTWFYKAVAVIYFMSVAAPYAYPTATFDSLTDHQLMGVVLWAGGSSIFVWAAMIVLYRWVRLEEHKPSNPDPEWLRDHPLLES